MNIVNKESILLENIKRIIRSQLRSKRVVKLRNMLKSKETENKRIKPKIVLK